MSPDFPDDFFKLTIRKDDEEERHNRRRTLEFDPIYPQNASEEQVSELDENCKFLGEICASLQSSLRYGFDNPKISQYLFIALHIYGNPPTLAYCPSRLINQHILIQNGDRFFLLDCRTGLVGSQDRRIGPNDKIVNVDGRFIIVNERDIGEDQIPIEPIPTMILKRRELSDQYIVRAVPSNKNTFVVIITQTDYPDRTVIKIN